MSVITDIDRIGSYKKISDRVYQIELEIFFFLIPSHPKNSQNSIKGSISHAAYSLVTSVLFRVLVS